MSLLAFPLDLCIQILKLVIIYLYLNFHMVFQNTLPLVYLLYQEVVLKEPIRGEIVVFKTPEDNKTDYIKRVVGLPGDSLEMKDNVLIINDVEINITKKKIEKYKSFNVSKNIETLPNKLAYEVYEFEKAFEGLNTNNFNKIKIPLDYFFVLGDNRDNSQDSRFIGLIPRENLVGRAEVVVVSFDTEIGSFLKFWTWYSALRKDRFLLV